MVCNHIHSVSCMRCSIARYRHQIKEALPTILPKTHAPLGRPGVLPAVGDRVPPSAVSTIRRSL